MADFSKFFPKLMLAEGGSKFTDRPTDHGGATKFGITFKTWLACGYDKDHNGIINVNDLHAINEQDAEAIAKKIYWDKVDGDQIPAQPIAEFLCDWAYNSGAGTAVKQLQHSLGVTADGIMGQHTLNALLAANQQALFNQLKAARLKFVAGIVANDHTQEVYLNGWVKRINAFQYTT